VAFILPLVLTKDGPSVSPALAVAVAFGSAVVSSWKPKPKPGCRGELGAEGDRGLDAEDAFGAIATESEDVLAVDGAVEVESV
jgi:hypothetical protein